MKITKIDVTLRSLSDIMFDKFIDHSKSVRPAEQKLYLAEDDIIIFPSENLYAFLFGEVSPAGCAKTFEGKKGKDFIRAGMGHVIVEPPIIPFLAGNGGGGPIQFRDFSEQPELYIYSSSPRRKLIKEEIT